METIEQRFERVKGERRDISEHLDTLYKYAMECDSIVELGVNEGISTTAFLKAKRKFSNVDVHITPMFQELIDMAKAENVEMKFTMEDDRKVEIPECDLLFIDTLHNFSQLAAELTMHGNKSRKFILMHDTETFKDVGIDGSVPGMKQAVDDFLRDNSHWYVKEHFTNNNGLTVLERREEGVVSIPVEKKGKKYLLATSAFANNDLLKICIKSWPKMSGILDKLVYFDGKYWTDNFKNLLESGELKKNNVEQLTLSKHMGVSGSWNQILKYAFDDNSYENVIIVGSDTEFKEGYLEGYIKEFEDNQLEFSTARGQGFNCWCMTRKCYEVVGTFDENFFPAYVEDNDFHRRVKLSQLKDGDIGNFELITHYGSASIRKNKRMEEANCKTFPMSQQQFRKKWGGEHDSPNLWKTPYNNSYLTFKDWILDKEEYELKKKIWDFKND
jgi:hypothetical protein